MRYRIRIGKEQFTEPHYITQLGLHPNYAPLSVNKNPKSWVTLTTAEKHLADVKRIYSGAVIEPYS